MLPPPYVTRSQNTAGLGGSYRFKTSILFYRDRTALGPETLKVYEVRFNIIGRSQQVAGDCGMFAPNFSGLDTRHA